MKSSSNQPIKRKRKRSRSSIDLAYFSNPRVNVENMPNEIMYQIFSYLDGTDLRRSSCVCSHWRLLIQSLLINDVLFICDITKSTRNYLYSLIDSINNIMPLYSNYRFGFIGYGDHWKAMPVTVVHPLTYNADKLVNFMYKQDLLEGRDYPEAVADGMYVALNINWRPKVNKHIIMLCDAPPHGYQHLFTDNIYDDCYPMGCPCGLDIKFILNNYRDRGIGLTMILLDDKLEQLIDFFKLHHPSLTYIVANKWNDFTPYLFSTLSTI